MTDKQFSKLKRDIEIKMTELEMLQKIYRSQTGQDYVMPLYLSDDLLPKDTATTHAGELDDEMYEEFMERIKPKYTDQSEEKPSDSEVKDNG